MAYAAASRGLTDEDIIHIPGMSSQWVRLGNGAKAHYTVSGDTGPAIAMAIVLGASAVVMLGFTRLRVTADRRGLRVVSRVFGIPLRRIPLASMASVSTAALRPSEWGGWGYRMSPGRSALILRAGPGLVVTTAHGSEFAISLSDPETPAALLETLRRRAEDRRA